MQYDLSVVIPSRNEMFAAETVKNILQNKRGKTEVIIHLDGAWANPEIPDHPDLTIIYSPHAIGQREGTNQAVRASKAKYVMKIDSHAVVGEGFDVKLLADMEDNWTMLPTMYNLHAFDIVCIGKNKKTGLEYLPEKDPLFSQGCGYRKYQGGMPDVCPDCGGNVERELIFKPRLSRMSTHYRFDPTPHFQYWNDLRHRAGFEGDISETMSIQGSCFLMTREKYWELSIGDPAYGSWGSQGIQVACSTWLSGGRVVTNRKTYFGHTFRTQNGFSFPYPISGSDQQKAKEYARNMWFNNKHPKQIYPLSWLLEKFWPIPGWSDEDLAQIKQKDGRFAKRENGQVASLSRNIIFYTDNMLRLKYAKAVQKQLRQAGLPIISSSLKPMAHFGDNVHVPLPRGREAYFTQIIKALERSEADIVYMCEHDVLYSPSHFQFIPPRMDTFYYNQNFWRIRPETDNFAVHWDANQVSGLVCSRRLLLDWYRRRWREIQENGFDRSYEPENKADPTKTVAFKSEYPNIDIRHPGTMTRSKWSLADFRNKATASGWQESTMQQIPGWDLSFLL